MTRDPAERASEDPSPGVRSGSSRRRAVARLLVLKLDHVGDLLIAAPALQMLRAAFPRAHVTLLCAPWNVALATRLGVADEVHAVAFFAQSSGDDAGAAMDVRRAQAAAAIAALELPSFDIAVDLRRDEDTRPLLKAVRAAVRAGFGDLATYGYLDVANAVTHLGEHAGAAHLHLGPAELDNGAGHRRSANGLHLTLDSGEVDLGIATDAVWAPADDGEPDHRQLGVALYGVHIQASDDASGLPVEVARETMRFGPGWLAWEPWGRWSSIGDARLRATLRSPAPTVRILARVQGHTSASHPGATVRLASGEVSVERTFVAGEEAAVVALDCPVRRFPPAAASAPALLRAGRYQGRIRVFVSDPAAWEPLTLRVRGSLLGQVQAELRLPDTVAAAGSLDFPFEVELLDSGEPIVVEVAASNPDSAGGVAIESVDLQCLQARSPRLPVSHMEVKLQELVAMVALRYGEGLAGGDERQIVRRLTVPRPATSAEAASRRLRAFRGRGRRPWRSQAAATLIGLGVGANKEVKHWPEAAFVDLARRLLGRPDVKLVFVGGPADGARSRAVIEQVGDPDRMLDLCATCQIQDLGELLAMLDGFIGLDTGTTHFAGRIGLPTFALFGASHDPREWGPVGARSGWAALDVPCRNCSFALIRQCPFDVACMNDLTPEAVWPDIERFLFA